MKSKLLKDLKDIVDKGLSQNPLPIIKGNSIRIKQKIVRKRKDGFIVYDIAKNQVIAKTNYMSSALALAKGSNVAHEILELDNKLLKHTNDANFFAHTIKTTKDEGVRESRLIRYEIACEDAYRVQQKIHEYIWSKW